MFEELKVKYRSGETFIPGQNRTVKIINWRNGHVYTYAANGWTLHELLSVEKFLR